VLLLIALLWCIYLWDCFVRLPPGSWSLRAGARKPVRAFPEPDLQLFGGSLGLTWTPVLPWLRAYSFHGDDLRLSVAERRLRLIEGHTRWLNIAAGVLFVWIMGVFTVLILTARLESVMLAWAIPAAGAWIVTFTLFVRSYRRVHEAAPPVELWLPLALSPISLMRAPTVVRFPAARDLHPVAAAAVLCDAAEFVRIARLCYFDNVDQRSRIQQIARSRQLADRLTAAPDEYEPGVSRFCPRCHSTYTSAATRCSDCEDIPLKRLLPRCESNARP